MISHPPYPHPSITIFSEHHRAFALPNMAKVPEEHQPYVLPHQDCNTRNHPQFKGIRKRKWGSWGSEIRMPKSRAKIWLKWGSWGSEIRMPKSRAKIWLGSYKTAELAARAYDAAVYCLRDPNSKFNFPDPIPSIPSAFSLTPHQIHLAAARHARDDFYSALPSPHNNNNSDKVKEREVVSVDSHSRSSSEEQAFWESLFGSSESLNFDNFPSTYGTLTLNSFPPIEDTLMLDFFPTWEEEENEQDGHISFHLWNV